jgi:hypothetical protein
MIFLKLDEAVQLDTRQVAQRLAERGVKVGVAGSRQFRLVTHYWIDDAGVERTIAAFGEIL